MNLDKLNNIQIIALINLGQPLDTQLAPLLCRIREALYSAFVANLMLLLLAIAIIIVGIIVGWIASNPDRFGVFIERQRGRPRVSRIEIRYRKWTEVIVKRFTPGGAYGLSFTIGLVALCLSVWFFGSVLEDVVVNNELIFFDMPIVAYVATHRIYWLTVAMRDLTIFGDGWFVISLTAIAGLFLRYKTKSWRPFVLLTAAMAGAGILDLILKITIARPRPPAAWMAAPATGYSLLSGHTSLTVIYGAIGYLLAKTLCRWQSKAIVWTIALILAFLIGISRIYLGVHWPTDVLGGWALASLWLSIIFTTTAVIEQVRGVTPPLLKKPTPSVGDISVRLSPIPVPQHFTPVQTGLNEAQVEDRIAVGQVNITKQRASRSIVQIFKAHIFTRFNVLLGSLLIVILLVGPLQDALFGIVIILNSAIGIIQELRAKWALDRFVIIASPKARVVRSGVVSEVGTEQIVIDEVIELRAGDQVPVDGTVLLSTNVEIDESFLTGEFEPVTKDARDGIYSGSFVIAGSCRIQAVRVGEQAYARKLANAARQFTLSRSELREGINRFLSYITWLLIPTSLILFVTQLLYMQGDWRDAIIGSVAGVEGMVPGGLVLLTSVVMASAVVRLARRRALIQELAAVEMLARVDVLCLDKTGTLTEGKMFLEKIIPAGDIFAAAVSVPPCNPRDVLGALAQIESSPDANLSAIASECQPPQGKNWGIKGAIPFSSIRKWSAVNFENYCTWVLGAPEVILSHFLSASPLMLEINQYTRSGKRVLALAYTEHEITEQAAISLPELIPAALVILGEHLRQDVAETLQYFKNQGVAVKVISGDHPHTVFAIASAAGFAEAEFCIDGRDLPADPNALAVLLEEYNVFGRVVPEQKRLVINALQKRGHVVAMIGDGVNDVLAIKQADFGIAMGSGTGACRAIAQLILLSNNFKILPYVIAEGRRVIANIERTANLFIAKTTYVFALALVVAVAQVPFPFLPRHLTLIGFLTIGMPALFLSLSPNTARAQHGFVSRVLRFSIPAGGISAAMTFIAYAFTRQIEPMNIGLERTTATLTTIGCGLSIFILLARPVTLWFKLLMIILLITFGIVVAVPGPSHFFALVFPPVHIWAIIVILPAICFAALRTVRRTLFMIMTFFLH